MSYINIYIINICLLRPKSSLTLYKQKKKSTNKNIIATVFIFLKIREITKQRYMLLTTL